MNSFGHELKNDFQFSIEEAKDISKEMFEFLNPQKKQYLGEEEVIKILNMAYLGLRTENDIQFDDIISYLNFHGGSEVEGKISYNEFENMIVRLLSLTETDKLQNIKKQRDENQQFYEDLKINLKDQMGEQTVESELKEAMNLFDQYDINQNGFLEEFEIPQILIDTYKAMGKDFKPTTEDVQQYINMMDLDKDGKISKMEYEIFVLKSLKQQGIN